MIIYYYYDKTVIIIMIIIIYYYNTNNNLSTTIFGSGGALRGIDLKNKIQKIFSNGSLIIISNYVFEFPKNIILCVFNMIL